jgi:transposase
MKKAKRPKPQKRYSRFCGIDVAKRKHVASVMDRDGEFIFRTQSFNNDTEGYQCLLNRLKEVGQRRRILVGMEATGHYWYALQDFLAREGYEVIVLNPIQTRQQVRKDIRIRKTDRIEARHIAQLLKNGDHKVSLVPGDFAMTCRQLTRLRYKLIRQGTQLKQFLWSRLHPVWPEYESLLANPFCKTGQKLLMTAPTPGDVLALGRDELAELVRKTSRGKYANTKAEEIWQAAQHTVGTRRGLDGARACIRSLLTQMEALTPIRKQLEADIDALADRLPGHIFTLPGINRLSAVSLFGETDPIETFTSGSQLVAFAGLDTTVFQTGQYEAPRRRITKRGSPFLRQTLWNMAHRACYQEGDLRNYWLRRRGKGLHHLSAVTATALKLCHVTWRVLIDRRDYLTVPPTANKTRSRKRAS